MFLSFLQILLLSSVTLYDSLIALLALAGQCLLLKKCGVKQYWKGAIPLYGTLQVARAVGSTQEGLALFVIGLITKLMSIAVNFFGLSSTVITMIGVFALVLRMVELVYQCRVYGSIVRMFGKKRRFFWILLGLLFEPALTFYFSLNKNLEPQWQAQEVEEQVTNYFSSAKAAVMDEGLTVNLEERTATELFKKHTLLRDIHMYIKPGSMVLLLGGSGAGKTTLLNAINGYEKAKAEVHLNGSNIYSEYKRMQYDIGFVPQLDLMRGNDTVLRTLTDAAALRLPSEMNGAMRKERVLAVMEIFGLKPVADNMVSKLSGGQRKRLSIAMEFLSNPSLFILDEPDSGLDGVMARELMQQLRNIADQGKIVIVITHTPDRVIDLFDDVIVLAKDKQRTGRLAYYGPITEAREFFGKDTMEHIVLSINRKEEGGEGRADEFVEKYAEVMQHG